MLCFWTLQVFPQAHNSDVVDATAFGSSIALTGPWKAAAGDGQPGAVEAQPELNDSRWAVLDTKRSLSSQGFGGAKVLWYRLHVHLRQGGPAAAVFIEGLDKNYRLYANGLPMGGEGGMAPTDETQEHPAAAYAIPRPALAESKGDLVLALEVNGGATGFFNEAPMGEGTAIELVDPAQVPARQSYGFAHHWGVAWVLVGLDLLVGLCGLVIWWSLRDQREYLALALWLLTSALSTVGYFRAHLQGAGTLSGVTLLGLVLQAVSLVAELEFMRLLLRERRSYRWLAVEVICALIGIIVPLVDTGRLPLTLGGVAYYAQLALAELFVGVVLIRGIVRGNREARLMLLPVILWSFTYVYRLTNFVLSGPFGIRIPELPEFHLFSYTIPFTSLTDALGLLSLMLIILQRTIRLSREKADLAAEVAAAEELQMLLLSRASRPTPGYHVETAYRPMQEVGGDFFLVQPCEEDQTVVAIVGDVSGKGLQAAMRVSMILGVLQREAMGHPDRVLARLNVALADQVDFGFTTACCVRLERDGTFCFANAGHLNPYVDGVELQSEGALPLGMDADAAYAVQRGHLLAGQRMMLLSDGVIEARNKKGELFGFERTLGLLRMDSSSVADVVQRFGQEDDITVLSLTLA